MKSWKSRTRRYAGRNGFTLLELLIVVLIITILGGVVGVQLAGRPYEARAAAVQAQLENFQLALQLYRMDQGGYPTLRQGLQALVRPSEIDPKPQRFPQDGYLDKREVPDDPWGNAYVYLIPGSNGEPFEILSYGRDGEPGGEGEDRDLSSSEL
jgi:general secretion pathway protein G